MSVQSKSIFTGAPDQLTTGAILNAPTGTALPNEATAGTLAAAFIDSGYIGEDGLKIGTNQSSTDIKDWSGNVVRSIMSEYGHSLTWSHLELNERSLKNFLGDANVTVTAATATTGTKIAARFNADEMPVKSWVFKIKDGTRRLLVVVPLGQLSERGEVTLTKTSAIQLPITLKTFPDASGNHMYWYSDDGVFIGAA